VTLLHFDSRSHRKPLEQILRAGTGRDPPHHPQELALTQASRQADNLVTFSGIGLTARSSSRVIRPVLEGTACNALGAAMARGRHRRAACGSRMTSARLRASALNERRLIVAAKRTQCAMDAISHLRAAPTPASPLPRAWGSLAISDRSRRHPQSDSDYLYRRQLFLYSGGFRPRRCLSLAGEEPRSILFLLRCAHPERELWEACATARGQAALVRRSLSRDRSTSTCQLLADQPAPTRLRADAALGRRPYGMADQVRRSTPGVTGLPKPRCAHALDEHALSRRRELAGCAARRRSPVTAHERASADPPWTQRIRDRVGASLRVSSPRRA